MVNQFTILDRIVEVLRSIPGLDAHMLGDLSRIRAYHDSFPDNTNLARSIVDLKAPGILAVWRGTLPVVSRNREVWVHRFSLVIKAAETTPVNQLQDYPGLWLAIMNGVPTEGNGQPFRRSTIDDELLPPNTPSIRRQSIIVSNDTSIDYFEINLDYQQIGDDD